MLKSLKKIASELVAIRKLLEIYVENDEKYINDMKQIEDGIEITDDNIINYIL